MVAISRGDVVLCDLNPVVGTEQSGVRPVVILQIDRANSVSPHTIIAPLSMRGIQFVVDDTGKKRAVFIDLSEWGEIWEDIYDVLASQSRRDEPTISWDDLRTEMEEETRKSG